MKMPDTVAKTPVVASPPDAGMPASSSTLATTTAEVGQGGSVDAAPHIEQGRDDMDVFFGIGIVINLTMFTALIIWGINQWKKSDARKK